MLAVFHDVYPDAPIYTLLHDPETMGAATEGWGKKLVQPFFGDYEVAAIKPAREGFCSHQQ